MSPEVRHIAAPDVCDRTSAVGESRHRIPCASVGQPTQPCLAAWKWLAKAYRQLGKDGSALVHDALINARTTRQIAESRGKTGLQWEKFFSMRLRECLNTLAAVYGFSREEKKIRASGTKTQIIGAQ